MRVFGRENWTINTHIDKGFDFLGHNIRKYNNKLLIKTAKKNVKTFMDNIRCIIKAAKAMRASDLINCLNPKIRGWANYYSHVVSSAVFRKVDSDIFLALWAWAKRRHPKKGYHWIKKKYFNTVGGDNWVFNDGMVEYKGRYRILRLLDARDVAIKRHIKVRSDANPYDPKYDEYFAKRDLLQRKNKSKNWGHGWVILIMAL